MKNNQFAIVDVDFETKIHELFKIGFLDRPELPTINVNKLFRDFLHRTLTTRRTISNKNEKLINMQANMDKNLLDFLEQDNLTALEFYNIALQLLQFTEEFEYNLEDPFVCMDKIGLPFISFAEKLWTSKQLVEAWYLLLNTHNKWGLNFLDFLASNGFYDEYQGEVPLFFNGKAQVVVNTSDLICEVVYVETDLDTDEDGKRDLVKVEVVRPNITNQLPSLLTASPYDQGINDFSSEQKLHSVKENLIHKIPNNTTYEETCSKVNERELPPKRKIKGETRRASETLAVRLRYSLNDFFLSRGFATVYATGIGGNGSEGGVAIGSAEQIESIKAIVEWLTGDRVAFTNKTDNIEIKAYWSNEKIAMTGKSYLGTLALAVATTGVKGLEIIIPEAAISSWYRYYRENGLVISPHGYPGEDADVLANLTYSRKLSVGDWKRQEKLFDRQLAEIEKLQDRATGNYNKFWDERNYLNNVKNIKADVLIVHGLNDWNVKPQQAYAFWQALRKTSLNRKIILHQARHEYINNYRSFDFSDILNIWLSHKLYGVDNRALGILPNVFWQDNTVAETWHAFDEWGTNENIHSFYLAKEALTDTKMTGNLTFKNSFPEEVFNEFTKNYRTWEEEIINIDSQKMAKNRLMFLSDRAQENMWIDGAVRVKLAVSSSVDRGMLSFMLIDYGREKRLTEVASVINKAAVDRGKNFLLEYLREIEYNFETEYKLISRGHINLQNRDNSWKTDPLTAGEFVDIDVELQPSIYILLREHKLGLIIYSTDFSMSIQSNEKISYTIDLENSKLEVPIRN